MLRAEERPRLAFDGVREHQHLLAVIPVNGVAIAYYSICQRPEGN